MERVCQQQSCLEKMSLQNKKCLNFGGPHRTNDNEFPCQKERWRRITKKQKKKRKRKNKAYANIAAIVMRQVSIRAPTIMVQGDRLKIIIMIMHTQLANVTRPETFSKELRTLL